MTPMLFPGSNTWAALGVIGSIPDSGAWRNWHTRVPQEHVAVWPCGFESRRPDQIGGPMPTVTIWHASWCAPCRGTLRDLVPTLEDEGIEPLTFDYQSERHRSKTLTCRASRLRSLITSQNDTAPKRGLRRLRRHRRLITSQNDTAPKRLALRHALPEV